MYVPSSMIWRNISDGEKSFMRLTPGLWPCDRIVLSASVAKVIKPF